MSLFTRTTQYVSLGCDSPNYNFLNASPLDMGPTGCPEKPETTNQRCVTPQKNEDLITRSISYETSLWVGNKMPTHNSGLAIKSHNIHSNKMHCIVFR
jgi:hypothetical protein